MAAINDLIRQITDPDLRDRIQKEVDKLAKQKKFGLVFEEHLPECTPLYDIPVHRGVKAALKTGDVSDFYQVLNVEDGKALCIKRGETKTVEFPIDDLVTIAEFGESIYPYLQPIDSLSNAPDSDLWHALIEADNYHALQLLDYLYAGKVDCIYIDPPYNSGARDWKYNNDYVDSVDTYRHSKWLSMMQKRLSISKRLLNPKDSVLIVTIDEKEYLHLGCLLEEMFPEATIQMISTIISNNGNARALQFSRTNEFIFFVMFGECGPEKLPLDAQWLGNLRVESSKSTEGFQWGRMIRGGNGSLRKDSPGCFYPVFITPDGEYKGIGDALPLNVDRNTVIPPEGCIAVWPIHLDGEEGRWSCQPKVFKELQEKGYIRFGNKVTDRGIRITYIQTGMRQRIENGEIKIVGREKKNGTVILETDSSDAKYVPGTQWAISSHDATYFGSKLLSSIIGKQRFSFPKSLYAVRDTLRFFVNNKPNALIVDFFAGSGTTLHAVNLLNAEDGGKRRCIMVTNNEVSVDEAKALTDKGYKPGDDEWEKLGIARYVTWPRTVCSIEGHDVDGVPLKGDYLGSNSAMADGFASNVVFFKLSFLNKTAVSLGMQLKELLPVLWMKAGAIGAMPRLDDLIPDMLILSENKFAVLVNEQAFSVFAEELSEQPEIQTVFLATDYEVNYRSMVKNLNVKHTYQLYRDYLDHFRLSGGRS